LSGRLACQVGLSLVDISARKEFEVARSSQTKTAVLGGLSVMPMTGYALREAIRDVLGHFWSESFGQIYPTLAELERQGYVRRRGSKRARSSTFAITASGRARLRELLAQPIQPLPPRNGLMLRLFFGRQLGPEACRSLVLEARADAKRRQAQYETIRHELDLDETHAEDRPFWLLTVSAGQHTARATIAWADEALLALDEIDASSTGAPEQRRRR
jgi:DNA-binding PadR family transcriptional regulator